MRENNEAATPLPVAAPDLTWVAGRVVDIAEAHERGHMTTADLIAEMRRLRPLAYEALAEHWARKLTALAEVDDGE